MRGKEEQQSCPKWDAAAELSQLLIQEYDGTRVKMSLVEWGAVRRFNVAGSEAFVRWNMCEVDEVEALGCWDCEAMEFETPPSLYPRLRRFSVSSRFRQVHKVAEM